MGANKEKRLIREARELKHCSDGYIQSQMWASRYPDTSLNDITNAIAEMRSIEEEERQKQFTH